jgi:hypothetical protein
MSVAGTIINCNLRLMGGEQSRAKWARTAVICPPDERPPIEIEAGLIFSDEAFLVTH